MNLEDVFTTYSEHRHLENIKTKLQNKSDAKILLKGLFNSACSFFAGAFVENMPASYLFILDDKERAAYFQNDLQEILPEKDILFFPSSYKRSTVKGSKNRHDSGSIITRTEVLNKLNTRENNIIVSYPEAVIEKVTTKTNLKNNTLELNEGEDVPIDFIVEILTEYDFERVDFVYEPGQFAVRGGIVDIYSYSNDYPFRIGFFDEEVESIRTFDTVSQLSKARFKKISIVPDISARTNDAERTIFLNFIPDTSIIWSNDFEYTVNKSIDIFENDKNDNFAEPGEIILLLKKMRTVEFANKSYFKTDNIYKFNVSQQFEFNKKFDLLVEKLIEYEELGYKNIILFKNTNQAERLQAILQSDEIIEKYSEKYNIENSEDNKNKQTKIDTLFVPVIGTIHRGFTDNDLKINCYTDHQIFGRYLKFKLKSSSYHRNKEALTIKEINTLQPGDFVVHSDHGIGKFGGLQTIDINGKEQDAIRVFYKNNDILLVNIHNLHKISKYKGKEGTQPKLYKLGSGVWKKIKSKTKTRVKDIARELISLYAKRKKDKGFAYTADTYLQHALESSFIYEDTPDQTKTTNAVKKDMESQVPMDRLVCGDVGFGKTEIAIRAAFKAVADNKQVAVLVPTTILALQHYKTFSNRLKDMPCNVDYISRMKSRKKQTKTLKQLKSGKLDILIGTHRIVGKDVEFKDLGLMIVDEEQKFGVAIKEKLKAIKVNVDTLTLTATPIPRTLQFSLMGARDLSIMNTPPPNRYPIITELHSFDSALIKDAINYEVQRNGQVFFIHNRIATIYEIEALINRLNPDVKTAVVHGRIKSNALEKIMTGFINEEYGVLLATTIIESGLDIPNVNTIIINEAQNFGLSDLHQLRGRVGRSNKKAFCYLLAPPLSSVSNVARRRLRAIETFSELGSGFSIAMQDLDIRGAGNLLGGEQSGFIADIGFETYHRILDEALLELREEEFKDLFNRKKTEKNIEIKIDIKFVNDCHIDTDLEVLFPVSYISDITERLKLYRELDKTENQDELKDFETRIIDRFGKFPKPVKELLDAVRLRQLAISIGIEKILLRNKKMVCYFVRNKDSAYYQSPVFSSVLVFLQKFPKKVAMSERKEKLMMSFQNIKTINDGITMLKMI